MDNWVMELLRIETPQCKYSNFADVGVLHQHFADVCVLHQHFYGGWCIKQRSSVLKVMPNKNRNNRAVALKRLCCVINKAIIFSPMLVFLTNIYMVFVVSSRVVRHLGSSSNQLPIYTNRNRNVKK
jgi:hypothetical protein